jgi:hypothetical protein
MDPTTVASLTAAVPQNKVLSWIRQPTTIQGIGLVAFAGLGYVLHALSTTIAESVLATGAILIGIPDNTGFLHKIAAANPMLVSVPPVTSEPLPSVKMPGVAINK